MASNRFFLASLGIMASFLLSCGKPVCVAGIGDCAAFGQPVIPQTGSMTVSLSNSSVNSGQQITLTISGGKPPYTLKSLEDTTKTYGFFRDPTNTNNTDWKMSTSSTTAIFYATASLPANTNHNVPITVNDSSAPILYFTSTVQVLGP